MQGWPVLPQCRFRQSRHQTRTTSMKPAMAAIPLVLKIRTAQRPSGRTPGAVLGSFAGIPASCCLPCPVIDGIILSMHRLSSRQLCMNLNDTITKTCRRSGGNVGDASFPGVFQRTGGRVGSGAIVFQALHRSAISTALCLVDCLHIFVEPRGPTRRSRFHRSQLTCSVSPEGNIHEDRSQKPACS